MAHSVMWALSEAMFLVVTKNCAYLMGADRLTLVKYQFSMRNSELYTFFSIIIYYLNSVDDLSRQFLKYHVILVMVVSTKL